MTLEKAQAEMQKMIDELPPLMADKGCVGPSAEFAFHTGATLQAWLHSNDDHKLLGESGCVNLRSDTFAGLLQQAKAHIAAILDPETAAMNRYMNGLAGVVDQGRADGISDKYVDPVSLTIQAISENLLAAPDASKPVLK